MRMRYKDGGKIMVRHATRNRRNVRQVCSDVCCLNAPPSSLRYEPPPNKLFRASSFYESLPDIEHAAARTRWRTRRR